MQSYKCRSNEKSTEEKFDEAVITQLVVFANETVPNDPRAPLLPKQPSTTVVATLEIRHRKFLKVFKAGGTYVHCCIIRSRTCADIL